MSKKFALPLPADVVQLSKEGATVLTFRSLASWMRPDRRIKKITAVERFLWLKADKLVFYGLETDTPFAPLILWDVAHVADVGSTIMLLGDSQSTSFLQRQYFNDALELIENVPGKKVFRKRAAFEVEKEKGLDEWTFGIPVGPEDATLLNVTVKRILEMDVPKKEILLCGRPASNFKYFDKVRIVGEDITAPPVKICAKKNRLAQEAQYPNLCIIHDRVFLPKDFYSVMKKFGDFFPFTGLQSVFFDDKFNFIPRRYSDFGVSYRAHVLSNKGIMRDNDPAALSTMAPAILPLVERAGFYSANIMRYHSGAYPTGSLYICKRDTWMKAPQNENLYWIEYEDLEQAYRATEAGIPCRVNPYGITQSLVSRPIIASVLGALMEPVKGPPRLIRPWSEALPLPRKPAIRQTYADVLAGMRKFAEKYVPMTDPVSIPTAAALRSHERLEAIANILCRVQLPRQEKVMRQFAKDFEKWILFDQSPYHYIEETCYKLCTERLSPVKVLLQDNGVLANHVATRYFKDTFCASYVAYLQRMSFILVLGTMVSAIGLFLRRKHIIYLKGGPFAYFRALFNTTPFRGME